MASCDDDFSLLGDEVNHHHNHHHHSQIEQQQHQLSSFSPFSSHHHNQQHHHHRYIAPKGGTGGGVSVPSRPFLAASSISINNNNTININHDNQCSESTAFTPQSDNHHRFTTTAEVDDDDEDDDDDCAFAPQSPESPQNMDDEEDDRNNNSNAAVTDASEDPIISSSKSHGVGGFGQLGIGITNTNIDIVTPSRHNHHLAGRISSSSSRQHPVGTDLDPHLKRKDLQHRNQCEDHLSDGAESPSSNYYSKKSRTTTTPANNMTVPTSAAAGATTSSSMDYRKDREEWSDSAIACLLDAYTDKYLQLNKGNLRGRDWEDVATVVSKRSEKHKSGKSVEQCKNKVDNLKKRYKVECQRLSCGSLAVSHWPWFKKMEQIVGSSSSSSKAATDDDKPSPLAASVTATSRQLKKYQVASPNSVSLANNIRMRSVSNPRWKRALLKISGVALAGPGPHNVDPKVILLIAREVAMASRVGVEVAIVIGGRNFFCGDTWVAATDTDRAAAYQIGMMASAMNALLLQASLEKIGIDTRVQTAFNVQEIAEPYIRRRAIRHLEKGRVVIFGASDAGIGNPLLTTDTAAALRASEIHGDVLLKATNMDHAYECHSGTNNNGFDHISFKELDSRTFSAMDMTAITFCAENNIPVIIFNLLEPGNISRALCGDQVGTLIDQSGRIS